MVRVPWIEEKERKTEDNSRRNRNKILVYSRNIYIRNRCSLLPNRSLSYLDVAVVYTAESNNERYGMEISCCKRLL